MKRLVEVACPTCHAGVPWSEASPWRPFCSARCRAIDLGDWATDQFVIAGSELCDQAGEAAPLATEPRQ